MDNESSPLLSPEEVRVLGCLLEKAETTPDAYPLSLNSLLLACNQKTNRHPVVDYDEEAVIEAIDQLKQEKLVFRVDVSGSRTAKYRHNFDELLGLSKASKALIAVLLLRGPQTLGELRTRSERMYSFESVEAVETELQEIADEVSLPLWVKLPRAPGQKEERFTHLLSGPPEAQAQATGDASEENSSVTQRNARDERIHNLETEVADLKEALSDLKQAFSEFQQQFL